jgi:1-acyl-sn-glycerol-3-phosphate acyltransferase
MKPAFFQGFSLNRAIRRLPYVATRLFCLGVAKGLCRLRVKGREFIPLTGSAIVAANHVSYLDPFIVGVAIQRHVHFMAKEELFRFRPLGWLLRQYQAFPVDRRRSDRQAMNWAISLLQRGEIVVIFPEGTRGDGSRLGPAKPGIALIAARTGAPVIPAYHCGTEKALPRGARFFRPHQITVTFGAPFRFADVQVGQRQGQVVAFSHTIMERIAALRNRSKGGAGGSGDRAHVAGDAVPTETREIKGQTG